MAGEDRQGTIHEPADTVGMCYGVCQEILIGNVNIHCIATKSIPQLLTNDWMSA
jgi:hypothetical protein